MKHYSNEIKEKALNLLSTGKPAAEISKLMKIPANVIYYWKSKSKKIKRAAAVKSVPSPLNPSQKIFYLENKINLLTSENVALKHALSFYIVTK